MKIHRLFFHFSMISAVLFVAASCQQRRITVAMQQYQSLADKSVGKLAARTSAAYRGFSTGTSYDYSSDFSTMELMSLQNQAISLPSWGQSGYFYQQPQQYMGNIQSAAHACIQQQQAIPKSKATYAVAMATLSRCLNRIVQQNNYLLTWMNQQNSPSAQQQWAYAMNFGRYGTYGQMPQSDYNYLYMGNQTGFSW